MKEITILGSTGSIGTQALEVIATNPDTLHVRVLAHEGRPWQRGQARRRRCCMPANPKDFFLPI